MVYSKDEFFLDKLLTVANVVSSLDGTLLTIIRSKGGSISYYLGILSKRKRNESWVKAVNGAFSGAMRGNFVGSTLKELDQAELVSVEKDCFYMLDGAAGSAVRHVAAVSGVVALRDKAGEGLRGYVQGIENLTDAIGEKDYTILMIADPVSSAEVQETIRGYERIYTELSTFGQTQLSISEQGSLTLSNAQTEGITKGITEGVSYSQSTGTTRSKNVGISASIHAGVLVPVSVGVSLGVNAGFSTGFTETRGTGQSHSETEQQMQQYTKTVGKTMGTGKSVQVTMKDRSIQSLLEQIDLHIKRLNECKSYGAFNCAAYVLSGQREAALSAASIYNALMRGEHSSIQAAQINDWNETYDSKAVFPHLLEYLRKYTHPRFYLDEKNIPGVTVTPASLVSGRELAIQFGLPKKSIQGLTVMEMAPFGRNVDVSPARPAQLGVVQHMGQDTGKTLLIDVDSLAAHTFITGSTGVGKSNTIYQMLSQIQRHGVNFLVIEPAKGEYKQVFGGQQDVHVYGTNVRKSPLIRMNPFSFPGDIHVLEHIDRLVEIFNACWPMYAAMPAVLKDAIEEAYRSKGWDLSASYNASGTFPGFSDLLKEFPRVMKRSAYSADTRNDYVGSLVTRVRSLTNGINGQIFCTAGEFTNEELFDRNVIVDLSRVGSVETKALLMGILVMKLQEYRLASGEMNAPLRHVTVLEEAHNLLRRCSDIQTQEGSNLQGKSVEMLANAIAELRTYGEGFLIADQAPGLMDQSVIRNTNTKIILRLPDAADRELVGRAASLNDDQIGELSKLPLGVAAVYQNDWLEPVLCHIARFQGEERYKYQPEDRLEGSLHRFYQTLFSVKDGVKLSAEDIDVINLWIDSLDQPQETEMLLRRALKGEVLKEPEQGTVAYNLFEGKRLATLLEKATEDAEGICRLDDQLLHMKGIQTQDLAGRIRQLLLQTILRFSGMERFKSRFEAYAVEGGVL